MFFSSLGCSLSSPGDLSTLSLAKCFRTVSSPITISSISVVIFNLSNSGICPSVSLVKSLAKYSDRILALVLLSSGFFLNLYLQDLSVGHQFLLLFLILI